MSLALALAACSKQEAAQDAAAWPTKPPPKPRLLPTRPLLAPDPDAAQQADTAATAADAATDAAANTAAAADAAAGEAKDAAKAAEATAEQAKDAAEEARSNHFFLHAVPEKPLVRQRLFLCARGSRLSALRDPVFTTA